MAHIERGNVNDATGSDPKAMPEEFFAGLPEGQQPQAITPDNETAERYVAMQRRAIEAEVERLKRSEAAAWEHEAAVRESRERAWAEVERLREEIRLTLMYGSIDYDRLRKALGL